MPDILIFTNGRAWPATAAATSSATFAFPDGRMLADGVQLSTSGAGRSWSVTEPQGCWRDYAELSLTDVDAVRRVVQRWGDLSGRLDPRTPVHSGEWYFTHAALGMAAGLWLPPDETGTSHSRDLLGPYQEHIRRFGTEPLSLSPIQGFMAQLTPEILAEISLIPDPDGSARLVPRALTLRAFLLASAASALDRRAPMRRCLYCNFWFEPRRKDHRFCSRNCKNQHVAMMRGRV
jgi:hypothetical protein